MSSPSTNLTKRTSIKFTIGGIIIGVGFVFAAGAWATSVSKDVSALSDKVTDIKSGVVQLNDKFEAFADVHARLTNLEQSQRDLNVAVMEILKERLHQ